MNTSFARTILRESVLSANLMQVATINAVGFPSICHVWFLASFEPDRLYFMSRRDRVHSMNIANDPRVAAGIAVEIPNGLGGQVRGVTATGFARPVPRDILPGVKERFLARWPNAVKGLTATTPDPESTPSQLYEISVAEWVLFDEINFPAEPRVTLEGQ